MEANDFKIFNNSYDNFAKSYKDSAELPYRKSIEEYTIMKLCGDVKGLKVLDLACGEGPYSRKMKIKGASEVFGVDLSSEMIKLAQASEKETPLGCKYIVHDVLTLEKIGEYDLVLAIYLLNYAQTKEELFKFCESAYKNLKKGGRFVGYNANPFDLGGISTELKKYGVIRQSKKEGRKEGDPIKITIYNKDGSEFSFNNFWWSPETYEEAFKMAGFSSFSWEGPFLDNSLTSQQKTEFDVFMANPPHIGFSMTKV